MTKDERSTASLTGSLVHAIETSIPVSFVTIKNAVGHRSSNDKALRLFRMIDTIPIRQEESMAQPTVASEVISVTELEQTILKQVEHIIVPGVAILFHQSLSARMVAPSTYQHRLSTCSIQRYIISLWDRR